MHSMVKKYLGFWVAKVRNVRNLQSCDCCVCLFLHPWMGIEMEKVVFATCAFILMSVNESLWEQITSWWESSCFKQITGQPGSASHNSTAWVVNRKMYLPCHRILSHPRLRNELDCIHTTKAGAQDCTTRRRSAFTFHFAFHVKWLLTPAPLNLTWSVAFRAPELGETRKKTLKRN